MKQNGYRTFRSEMIIMAAVAVLMLFAGCATPQSDPIETVLVKYVNRPVKADGKMSDPAWKDAVEYKLHQIITHNTMPPKTAEAISKTKYWTNAWVKVLYDEKYLYIGFRVENDDVHAKMQKDQEQLFCYGDCMEVFLKPANSNAYLELYANPSGNKTTYFFPSRSFVSIRGETKLIPGVEVYSHVDGTLNNSSDTDKGWTSVMTIERKMLEKQTGIPFGERHPWTVLFAGYAYSKTKIHASNFTYPTLPQLHYHRTEYYAPIILEKAKELK